jgi:hypothetical protein
MKTVLTALMILTMIPAIAPAEQYVRGNNVVHRRVAPVVMHRVLPPFRGVHVYEGRSSRR